MYPIYTRCSDALTLQPASNELALIPAGKQPTYPIVLEKLRFMESCIEELHEVVRRLVRDSHSSFPPSISSSVSQDKLFLKMVKIIRGLVDPIVADAIARRKARGPEPQNTEEMTFLEHMVEHMDGVSSSTLDARPLIHAHLRR